ncbi:MAG: hypothetical protein Q8P95_05095 [bacterium]|nr:hypothetical protein [bacterium]
MVYILNNQELLDPLHPVQSALLEVVAEHPQIKMPELHLALTKSYKLQISLANLYRTVSQLIEQQVLVKSKGGLGLHSVWISYLENFSDKVKLHHGKNDEEIIGFQLAEGERSDFFAESLMALDPTWNHLLVRITELCEQPQWFVYNSHPWYPLGFADIEARFYRSLVQQGATCQVCYGNNHFLDEYGCKMTGFEGFATHTNANAPFLKEGYCLWVCDDYILECIFPEVIAQHFAMMFQSVQQIDYFEAELFKNIFKMRARCKVSVRRSKKEAEQLRKKIQLAIRESSQAKNKKISKGKGN